MRLIFSIISFFSLLIFIRSRIIFEKNQSDFYQRLASSYCFIDDYPSWLEQQSILNYFLAFAQFFYIDTDRIEQALEQYYLQRECLRALEGLPLLVEGG